MKVLTDSVNGWCPPWQARSQDPKLLPTDFLKRLHSLALQAVERGGMTADQVNSQVLRQFESNCADEDLLQRLDLRDKFKNPDAVEDLLFSVRTEEARRRTGLAPLYDDEDTDGSATPPAEGLREVETPTIKFEVKEEA